MAMSNYLGRCKETGCGFALFATREDISDGETFRDVKVGAAARVGNNGVFGRCANGHKVFPMKLVRGTYSAVHECDSRCLNAKGNNCTCSCGGANHGRGHASVIASAGEVEAAVEVKASSVHLGEIGQHIRGTASVIHSRDVNDATLYTFRATNGAIIKWFCPSYANPEYEVGKIVTFRAKVKKHDTWNSEAQTVVTYLEEVE